MGFGGQGCRVQDPWLRIQGFGFQVYKSEFRVQG